MKIGKMGLIWASCKCSNMITNVNWRFHHYILHNSEFQILYFAWNLSHKIKGVTNVKRKSNFQKVYFYFNRGSNK